MPLELAKGVISFNPQPTARNLNKPALMLRVGQNGEGDTQDFAIVLAAVLGFWTVLNGLTVLSFARWFYAPTGRKVIAKNAGTVPGYSTYQRPADRGRDAHLICTSHINHSA